MRESFSGGVQRAISSRSARQVLEHYAHPQIEVLKRGNELVSVSPEIRNFLMLPVTLIITKSDAQAKVHRRVALDYIGLKLFGGQPFRRTAHRRPLHSSAYAQSPRHTSIEA
jgi:glutamate dehydrogenase